MCVFLSLTLKWKEDDEDRWKREPTIHPPHCSEEGRKPVKFCMCWQTKPAELTVYKNIYPYKKDQWIPKRKPELIFFFSCLLGMRLEWAAVRVGAEWGQEMARSEEISEKLTLLVSFYIKMQMAFYLNLALCFPQCLWLIISFFIKINHVKN